MKEIADTLLSESVSVMSIMFLFAQWMLLAITFSLPHVPDYPHLFPVTQSS